MGNADVISIPGILSGGRGGCLLRVVAGERVGNAIFPGIPSGRGGRCLPQVGAGVSVEKFLEVTLNGARVGVRIAHVINIFLARDGPITISTPIFVML